VIQAGILPGTEEVGMNMKTILVVEDDAGIGSFLVQAITQETSHRALLVTDSLEALRAIPEIEPGLLILDYQLPYMNGIELYDRLQGLDHLKSIPTIMISARLPLRDLKSRNIIGLRKPFELEEFFNLIEKLLS